MANLRTNNLSGDLSNGQNAYRGSVSISILNDDYLSIADSDDFDIGTGDFTALNVG